jgi:hypothetical protein
MRPSISIAPRPNIEGPAVAGATRATVTRPTRTSRLTPVRIGEVLRSGAKREHTSRRTETPPSQAAGERPS